MAKRRRQQSGATTHPRPRPGGPVDAAEAPSLLEPAPLPAMVMAVVVTLAALAAYIRTLAPTVTLVDSGELIVASQGLGVAHPPGFPLYVLLAHAATWLPFGNVAHRVNAASAVFAALACGLLVLAAREAILGTPRRSQAAPTSEPASWPGLVPLWCAGLSFAFTRTLWSYATVAEVYTLNTLLLIGVWLLMFRWRRDGGPDRRLLAAAFLFGLALGVHHVTIALSLPALGALVLGAAGSGFFRSRRLAHAAAISVAGLVLVYAYLPWAASRAPALDWGHPATLERIVWHVTGRQYQAFFSVSAEAVAREVSAFLSIASREFGPPWLPVVPLLAGYGLVALFRRDRTLFGVLALLFAADVAYGLVYSIAEDKDAYFLPAFVAVVLAAAVGADALLRRAQPAQRTLLAGALALVPVLPLVSHFRICDRRGFTVANDYVNDVLDGVGRGGLLLTSDWQVYSPLFYLRTIENRRPDVAAIDLQLLRRSWYFDQLRREYPELMERAKTAVDAFLEDLVAWERDPDLYKRDAVLGRRIATRYEELVLALVRQRLESAPVAATRDVVLAGLSPDPSLAQRLAQTYALAPRGLVFDLSLDHTFHAPPPVPRRARAIFDGTLRVEPDDVVALKVRPAYLTMMASRGFYLAAFGDRDGAIAAYDEALALDPGFEPARQGKARIGTDEAAPPTGGDRIRPVP